MADNDRVVTAQGDVTGLVFFGFYLGLKDAEPRESRGRTYVNCDVGLRLGPSDGDPLETVQYSSRKAAEAAIAKWAAGAKRGQLIGLPVTIRSGVSNGRPWQIINGLEDRAASAVDAADFSA